ncbi:MAG: transcription antitermination factor NusB [Candidatus Margulisbacteria bacterium]|nr:transcription antitermination factor NusB [Candidatus Margulisiibacteriota bacterium]
MGKRKTSRKLAMQALYQYEIQKDNADFILEYTLQKDSYIDDTKEFASEIFYGVIKNKEFIDNWIIEYAIDWKFERISLIDKAILRIAIWELLFTECEVKIIISEAIDLIKKYSMKEAIKFVNGILGRIVERRQELSGKAN